ncbi:MAG: sensor histidine kinase [Bdellovibrionia bacterium]
MPPMQRPAVLKSEDEVARTLHIVPTEPSTIDIRDEFISLASHELKTPLTALLLEVELQKRRLSRSQAGALSAESIWQLMGTIDRHAWQLGKLIEDMLDSAKLSNGSMELEKKETDLKALIEAVAYRHDREVISSGSRLELDLQPYVLGHWDSERIEQVVSHLLLNAVKYGAGQPIRISLKQQEQNAQIKIIDQGMGIPADSLERIFSRFERAVPATHISGLGLGLFISRRIVEMHQGQIWAESHLQQGATFTVVLPLNRECAS